MKVLYCHDSFVPIDKIASVAILQPGPKVIVLDVTGGRHVYYDASYLERPFDTDDCRVKLFNLAAWLKAGAPDDKEP